MAVIDIRTEPSGRTRMLFDFRVGAPGCDDVARIASVMTLSYGATSAIAPVAAGPLPPAQAQAASARKTKRPVTLPSRSRISAS